MSFFNILDTLLLGPLKLAFEWIFQLAYALIGHPGFSIIALSLVMNVLVLPLYKRADAMQEQARDTETRLKKGVDHIKKTFSGDERMMILQAYYRENNYKPTDALKGSISLLLEIPFFMAAYQFLSHLQIMNGVSLGPIKDLSAPDGLLVIGTMAINVLPILMTLINVISSAIYLKGFPLKTKIQLYGIAIFFLIFLYESPSCLVFYWTLNNVFSLVKNIFYKLKEPRRIINIMVSAAGLGLLGVGIFVAYPTAGLKVFLILFGIGLQMPAILSLVNKKRTVSKEKAEPSPNKGLFILGSVFLTVLVGAMIPTTYIAASPQEYVDIGQFFNPLWYVVSALCFSAGVFLVWLRVFYWLASPKGKVLFERVVWILSVVMLANYMFFGTKLGTISPSLKYEQAMLFSTLEQILNIAVMLALGVGTYFIVRKWGKTVRMILLTGCLVLATMSVINAVRIGASVSNISQGHVGEKGHALSFDLSKNGNNVVVVMLDRGMGQHIPYIFNEKPELKEKFSGFTYYGNTVSYGRVTNIAAPAIYGGYEYTPVELNRRDQESLKDKHNEALKMMPTLFSNEGYDVTVVDPPYANYEWVPDISIFDDMPGVNAYMAEGVVRDERMEVAFDTESNKRNFFCFSLMKTMPLMLQPALYDEGRYNKTETVTDGAEKSNYADQYLVDMHESNGIGLYFMKRYLVMERMSQFTNITDDNKNTFLCMTNNVTHDPILLQAPDYVPADHVDNNQYDGEHSDRFTVNGRTMRVENANQMMHYHANAAAMMQLANWFDYLRQEGVYDNTRIILVSDHGRGLRQFDGLILDDGNGVESEIVDAESYAPLLMVKDFHSTGFKVSDDFMTNADVPSLAVKDLIRDPVNPFTKKPLTNREKKAHPQYVLLSDIFNVNVNNGECFLPGRWATVKDDIWNPENWTLLEDEQVLKENETP